MALDYKQAGVDVEAGYKAVELMKKHVGRTMREEVVTGLGGFSGLFSLGNFKHMEDPILVSGTDGVGTKLKLAFELDQHDTIGIDAVAMCVNDIICCGAEPLFFLDYIACGKNHPEKIADIVKGIADGCVQAGSALIGGETAEMPGFYPENEYDLAGFAVGIVDKAKLIDGRNMKDGDLIIGLSSSGIHSNGYSLVRKIIDVNELQLDRNYEPLTKTLGDELITPTKIYVKACETLKKDVDIKAISHITGGGFYENIPRMMQKGFTAKIQKGSWQIPEIFNFLQKKGDVSEEAMYNTFNMGIGMAIIINKEDAEKAIEVLKTIDDEAVIIGEVVTGDEGIILC
ncbi:phosphoribosylformylglycinamidine cyclo-ligase [Vallitalea okinawensis]|uniref:phosphoribosylformylglycinamidine cyclo-ligase n=1 Tax=Vallitalea okinawensis TaxID=2078660 RepID=UPI000CFBBD3A|nr:phosphoribosylformylglycinamidine cyclo-ligase [Vallitalea okinawensis]